MARFTVAALMAALAAVAQAVQLTNSEFNVEAGQPFTIEWSDASGPVTLRLKSGPSDNLVDVQEITSGQTGTSFTWNVPTNLPSAQYAFEILDGSGESNFSLQFPIAGDGTAATSAGSAAPTTAATAAVSSAVASATSAAAETTSAAEESTSAATSAAESSETEAASSAVESSAANSTTVTTRVLPTTTSASRPSSTSSDSDASRVPDSGAAGQTGSAVLGAIIGLGALLMAY